MVAPLPTGLHCFDKNLLSLLSLFLCVCYLFKKKKKKTVAAFKIFIFIIEFVQFNYSMHWYSFLLFLVLGVC